MAKKAKKIQTDYTKGGRDISNTAIPLYQTNLQQIGDYTANPSARTDEYLDKYYTDTSAQNDFWRNYGRIMGNKIAQNYSATGGGYSSAGQRAFNDTQMAQNDLATRLYDQGVANASAMAQQDFNNLLQAGNAFNNAYGHGKEYSDIEQYNNMVKQNNKWYNQVGQALPAVGSAIGGEFGGGIGATLGGSLGNSLGGQMSVDTSDFFNSQRAGVGAQQGQYASPWNNLSDKLYKYYAGKEVTEDAKKENK